MMFRKIFLLSILIFSLSYAVDEIDIEKREIYGQLDKYKFTFDIITRDINSIQNLSYLY